MAKDSVGADIFLSYAREDQERAETLAKALMAQGWTVFWDRTVPAGQTWDDYIGENLDEARCVVVAWSAASTESKWVREEAREGRERETLVPVLFDKVRPPFGFRGIQAADLSAWDGGTVTPVFKQLVADISVKLGPPPVEVEARHRADEEHSQREAQEAERATETGPRVSQEDQQARQTRERSVAGEIRADTEKGSVGKRTSSVRERPQSKAPAKPGRRSWPIVLWLVAGAAVIVVAGLLMEQSGEFAPPSRVDGEAAPEPAPPPIMPLDSPRDSVQPSPLPASEREEVRPQTMSDSARLTVRSNVTGDIVFIDGQARGPTGPKAHELTPGTYTVRVDKPGYKPWEYKLSLAAGERETVRAEMVRVPRPKAHVPDTGIDEDTQRAARRAGETWTEPRTSMEFVWVPEGCFQMGSEQVDKDEKPVHRVCVKGFWLGKYEVTQGQWKQVMGENPARFEKGADHPVENVSWIQAQAFIRKLNGKGRGGLRLPSEAEWEYACRSGGRAETFCGGEDVRNLAWYWENSADSTYPVGRKQANGLGLHDMSGNVWEWQQDCYYDSYEDAPDDGSAWEESSCSRRVIRGGSWGSYPVWLRSSTRTWYDPDPRSDSRGFRLALDL